MITKSSVSLSSFYDMGLGQWNYKTVWPFLFENIIMSTSQELLKNFFLFRETFSGKNLFDQF